MTLGKNWILTEQGDAINLDFLTKVLTLPKDGGMYQLVFYHGIGGGTGMTKGATISYPYPDLASANAAYAKVVSAMMALGIITDVSQFIQPSIEGISPASGSVDGGDVITITGSGFVKNFNVTINGASCTNLIFNDTTSLTVTTPPSSAGVFSLVYSVVDKRPSDITVVYPSAFTYS